MILPVNRVSAPMPIPSATGVWLSIPTSAVSSHFPEVDGFQLLSEPWLQRCIEPEPVLSSRCPARSGTHLPACPAGGFGANTPSPSRLRFSSWLRLPDRRTDEATIRPSPAAGTSVQCVKRLTHAERRCSLARGKFLEGCQELSNDHLGRYERIGSIDHPTVVST